MPQWISQVNLSMSLELLPHFFFQLPDGGRLRYAHICSHTRPEGTVLIVPGAREFIEKKVIELSQPLLDKGFRIIIYEPRGQGLSTRFLKGKLRQRDHIDEFSTHLDDLRAFYSSVVRPGLTEPLIVHGHSLGAHLLLRWLAEDQPRVEGAFLTSPMVALSGMAAHMASYAMSWAGTFMFGQETAYAPLQHDFGEDDLVFPGNPLTADEQRFRIIENYFNKYPDLVTGGVTWGWMLAALRSMNVANTWPYMTGIKAPVLALMGDQDPVTPPAEIAPYLALVPNIRTRIISGARHDILSEMPELRAEAWDQIDEFINMILKKHVAQEDEVDDHILHLPTNFDGYATA